MSRNICLLLILLLGSAAVDAVRARPTPETKKVAVFYFHNTIRCATCMRMEQYSEFAIQAGFPNELKSGKIEWRVVNMQLPENRHFAEDFQLHMSSLVIVRFKDGKQVAWRNLEKIWDHVGDINDFVKYVQSNVRAFLNAD